MATQWTTFPMEFKGGLISNLTPLQQGTNAVGSATILQNFESDREGGYSKLQGYNKFSTTEVPGTGEVLAMKVVSSGRVVTSRKMDTATITEYQTATSTVNGAVSNATAVALDNNTATAIVNGAITSKTSIVVDRVRAFTGSTGTASGTGSSATFNITNTNGTYTAALNAAGTAYAPNETVTVVGASLGGATAANNATVTVTGIAPTTHTTPANIYNGTEGTGFTFNVTRTGASYSMAIVNAGSGGYKVGDTVTVVGANLGGATSANNATITVNSVNNVPKTYTNPTQSAYGGSGSSATFNVSRSDAVTQFAVTVVNSGGNKYALNGVTNPTLTLVQGTTYTFDVSHSSNSGHPFRFKDAGGNTLTAGITANGTAGQAGATVTYAVPSSGTMPALYYCTVHGNAMGNTIATASSASAAYTVAVTAGGSGYVAGQTLKVVGTQLGGATTANDATITIASVDGSGVITGATISGTPVVTGTVATAAIAGTAVNKGPITTISVAGTGAPFGTITRGMKVTGAGISGVVTVQTVTNQNNIILDRVVSLADNAVLSFITNIKVGMFVTGAGISGDVKVAAVTSQNNITLASAKSIANNTVLTFGTFSSSQVDKTVYFHGTGSVQSGDVLSWPQVGTSTSTNTNKVRYASFNFTQEDKTIFVDGKSFPMIYNASGNTTVNLSGANSSDIQGAEIVAVFKNHAFYSKGSKIFFTAPNTVDDFATSNGAGTINVGFNITGMIGFREQLIIFTTDTIKKLVGNTSSDFKLEPITDRIGCINPDSIQEFGGDVAYLSPDGIRLLSATDRIGDFALDIASDPIYKDANEFIAQTDTFCSVLVRGKSQYRLFAYVPTVQSASATGLIATKFIAQGGSGIAWSTTKGLKVNVADSTYSGAQETIMFGNDDGFCYVMDSGTSFDGASIESIYESPFMPITDPQLRKTMYKLTLYAQPTGTMNLSLSIKLDFDSANDPGIVQPAVIPVTSTSSGSISLFGSSSSVYGSSSVTYGGVLDQIYKENVIGSFKTFSMRITDNSINPTFTLDTAVLEYRQNDRQ